MCDWHDWHDRDDFDCFKSRKRRRFRKTSDVIQCFDNVCHSVVLPDRFFFKVPPRRKHDFRKHHCDWDW